MNYVLEKRSLVVVLVLLLVGVFLFYLVDKYLDNVDYEESNVIQNDNSVDRKKTNDVYDKGINILKESVSEDVLKGTAEVVFKGKALNSIYSDKGFNKIDFVPDDYSEKLTLVLNDKDVDSFPLSLVDKKGSSSFKTTKISTINAYLSESDEVKIKCNILVPEVFDKECNHDKCDLWSEDVKRFSQVWSDYVEAGAWPSEVGFCVSIDLEIK